MDQFNVWLLIVCLKKPAVLKRQRFDDSESKETAPKKRQQFDVRNNKEGQSLDENESKVKGNRYIPLPSPTLPSVSQKKSNRPSDLGKRTMSLIHFVYISQNC